MVKELRTLKKKEKFDKIELPLKRSVAIIIPTMNNLNYLVSCLSSIINNTFHNQTAMLVINNGGKGIENHIKHPSVYMLQNEENKGWEGALNQGIELTKSDYVMFLNDDTYILPNNYDWLNKMIDIMDNDKTVGAVGSSSNVVMGVQNIFTEKTPRIIEVPFLIGFCMLVRRDVINKIGLIDENLHGGDDLDYSIRIKDAGYKLICRKDVFVFHHGFKTGETIDEYKGERVGKNYWNSMEMQEKTNRDLIRKHGFLKYINLMRESWKPYITEKVVENEDKCLLDVAVGKGIEVGCGGKKITSSTIGIDIVPKGERVPIAGVDLPCVADIQANGDNLNMFKDNELDYVISRHSLEHFQDPVKTLKEWYRVLKTGGKLGLVLPDEDAMETIRLDTTHKHTYTRNSTKNLLELVGFSVKEVGESKADWSFFVIAEK